MFNYSSRKESLVRIGLCALFIIGMVTAYKYLFKPDDLPTALAILVPATGILGGFGLMTLSSPRFPARKDVHWGNVVANGISIFIGYGLGLMIVWGDTVAIRLLLIVSIPVIVFMLYVRLQSGHFNKTTTKEEQHG